MLPIEGIFILLGWAGLTQIWFKPQWWIHSPRAEKRIRAAAWILLILNISASVQPVLFGDRFKHAGGLFDLGPTAKVNHACGIIINKTLPSLALPQGAGQVGVAFASGATHQDLKNHKIVWYEKIQNCKAGKKTLVYLPKEYSPGLLTSGCKPVQGGSQRFLSKRLFEQGLKQGWITSLWALCDEKALKNLFGPTYLNTTEQPISYAFNPIKKLPGLKTTGDQLISIGKGAIPKPDCRELCF